MAASVEEVHDLDGEHHRRVEAGLPLGPMDAELELLAAPDHLAEDLIDRGYTLIATGGTCRYLRDQGFYCEHVNKVTEGRPHIVDAIKNDEIHFIINTTEGRTAIRDSFSIRREALQRSVPYTTTIPRGWATLQAIDHERELEVHSLQELHRRDAS